MSIESVFFFTVATIAVASALLMITRRNPVQSVLLLIVNFFCLAVIYLALHAQFIAVIQVLVYAGAIMVLFLFVIMLLNLVDEHHLKEKRNLRRLVAYAFGVVVLAQIVLGLGIPSGLGAASVHPNAISMGTTESIGRALFTDYLLPFEITSVLLLVAMVGVIVLAKKRVP